MLSTNYCLPTTARSKRAGFTLIELVIYTGLTVVVLGLLGGILVTVTRVQGVQNSSAQVTKELSFLMSSIKQSIRSADAINAVSATSLTFTAGGISKTIAYLGTPDFKITLTDPNGTEALSSTKIKIDNLEFGDIRDGATANRAIQIKITASANTDNAQKTFTRTIQSTTALFLQEQ
jgi:type II secretory pathway pseudopilin PulG